jgi:hypothetical protein
MSAMEHLVQVPDCLAEPVEDAAAAQVLVDEGPMDELLQRIDAAFEQWQVCARE